MTRPRGVPRGFPMRRNVASMIARGVAGEGDGRHESAGRRRPGGVTMTHVLPWVHGTCVWIIILGAAVGILAGAMHDRRVKRENGRRVDAIDANGSCWATLARLATTTALLKITSAPAASAIWIDGGRAHRRGGRCDRRRPPGRIVYCCIRGDHF